MNILGISAFYHGSAACLVRDGEIVIRDMMYLSVSFDHRWIDGAEGARFMSAYARLISNPNLLLARL